MRVMPWLAVVPVATGLFVATPAGASAPPKIPAGTAAGYVLFDRQAGKIIGYRNVHRKFRSASVSKILIAIDFLERTPKVSQADARLLRIMLRSSDDDAATAFWNRGGKGKIIERMARKLRLSDTAPPPTTHPGYWGYVTLSAHDVLLTYRYLLDSAKPSVRDLVLGHLRQATKCGTDGFDQSFGIPAAVPRPWAVKQGWSGFGDPPAAKCTSPATRAASDDEHPAQGRSQVASEEELGSGRSRGAFEEPGDERLASGRWRGGARLGPAAVGRFSAGERARRMLTGGLMVGQPPAVTGGSITTAASRASKTGVPDLGRPVLHSTGLVGAKERYILVLLTAHPAGGGWNDSVKRINRIVAGIYKAV